MILFLFVCATLCCVAAVAACPSATWHCVAFVRKDAHRRRTVFVGFRINVITLECKSSLSVLTP